MSEQNTDPPKAATGAAAPRHIRRSAHFFGGMGLLFLALLSIFFPQPANLAGGAVIGGFAVIAGVVLFALTFSTKDPDARVLFRWWGGSYALGGIAIYAFDGEAPRMYALAATLALGAIVRIVAYVRMPKAPRHALGLPASAGVALLLAIATIIGADNSEVFRPGLLFGLDLLGGAAALLTLWREERRARTAL